MDSMTDAPEDITFHAVGNKPLNDIAISALKLFLAINLKP